jgi:hypothetical protein
MILDITTQNGYLARHLATPTVLRCCRGHLIQFVCAACFPVIIFKLIYHCIFQNGSSTTNALMLLVSHIQLELINYW